MYATTVLNILSSSRHPRLPVPFSTGLIFSLTFCLSHALHVKDFLVALYIPCQGQILVASLHTQRVLQYASWVAYPCFCVFYASFLCLSSVRSILYSLIELKCMVLWPPCRLPVTFPWFPVYYDAWKHRVIKISLPKSQKKIVRKLNCGNLQERQTISTNAEKEYCLVSVSQRQGSKMSGKYTESEKIRRERNDFLKAFCRN